jgi:hypothetical protein
MSEELKRQERREAQLRKDLQEATAWLVEASAAVPRDYFMLPVVGKERPIYRERVYCYELYHQWRCLWRADFGYSLCGEIDKEGHPVIRSAAKPDFLVHSAGSMNKNLLALEVKPYNSTIRKMLKDLRTLSFFRRNANYVAAYFLVYGVSEANWTSVAERLANLAEGDQRVDLALIVPAIHVGAGERVRFVNWK